MNSFEHGNIFLINDFLKIAKYNTIRSNLMRLSDEGKIVKLMNGIYTIPEYSKLLDKNVNPSAKKLALKIAEKIIGILFRQMNMH